jgi:ferrous iron transport protein A
MSAAPSSCKKACELVCGECAIIERLERTLLGLKLLEMGCLPGKAIELIRTAPMGGPLYLKVGAQSLALRPEEAEGIEVRMKIATDK